MRWVVELPAETGGSAATVTVDGESWKAALSAARSGKALPKYRCDFDEDGTVRVHDFATNERFALRPLKSVVGADAPPRPSFRPITAESTARGPHVALGSEGAPRTAPVAEARLPEPALVEPHTAPSSEPARIEPHPAPSPPAADQSAIITAPIAPATVSTPAPATTPRPSHLEEVLPVPAPATLMFQRGRDPVGGAGLTYRERVLLVPSGTPVAQAESIAREVWAALRTQLARFDAGQFITIAVFDHAFRSIPERAPLLVLNWKDWRGEPPHVTYGAPAGAGPSRAPAAIEPPAQPSVSPPPERAVSVPPPASAVAEAVAPVSRASVAPPPAVEAVATPPAAAPPPADATAAASQSPPSVAPPPSALTASPAPTPSTAPAPSVRPPSQPSTPSSAPKPAPRLQTPADGRSRRTSSADGTGKTRRSDELLADAFEATQDLAFLREPDEACALVAALARDLLAAPYVAVSLYDIDRDELVLQSVEGGTLERGRRAPLAFGPRGEAAIRGRVVIMDDPPGEDPLLGVAPAGPGLYAPAQYNRRLFAVIEMRRAGIAFRVEEQHAATFIAEQLGKFLAEHSRRIGFRDDR